MSKIASSIKITFPAPNTLPDKVETIKAVRALTGLGLKESKDMVDAGGEQVLRVVMPIPGEDWATGVYQTSEQKYEYHVQALRNQGVIVTENSIRGHLVSELKAVTNRAVADEQYDLAVDLITLLKRYS